MLRTTVIFLKLDIRRRLQLKRIPRRNSDNDFMRKRRRVLDTRHPSPIAWNILPETRRSTTKTERVHHLRNRPQSMNRNCNWTPDRFICTDLDLWMTNLCLESVRTKAHRNGPLYSLTYKSCDVASHSAHALFT